MIYKIQVKRIGERVISRYERVTYTSAKKFSYCGCEIAIVDFGTDSDLSHLFGVSTSGIQKTLQSCVLDNMRRK